MGKGSAGKPTAQGHDPRQQAQQLKKQLFNNVVNDLDCNKDFFMSFVCHPSFITTDGVRSLLSELNEVKQSKDYEDMAKTAGVTELRRKRDHARLAVKRGRLDYNNKADAEFARGYANGVLHALLSDAETDYAMCFQGDCSVAKPTCK